MDFKKIRRNPGTGCVIGAGINLRKRLSPCRHTGVDDMMERDWLRFDIRCIVPEAPARWCTVIAQIWEENERTS